MSTVRHKSLIILGDVNWCPGECIWWHWRTSQGVSPSHDVRDRFSSSPRYTLSIWFSYHVNEPDGCVPQLRRNEYRLVKHSVCERQMARNTLHYRQLEVTDSWKFPEVSPRNTRVCPLLGRRRRGRWSHWSRKSSKYKSNTEELITDGKKVK